MYTDPNRHNSSAQQNGRIVEVATLLVVVEKSKYE